MVLWLEGRRRRIKRRGVSMLLGDGGDGEGVRGLDGEVWTFGVRGSVLWWVGGSVLWWVPCKVPWLVP